MPKIVLLVIGLHWPPPHSLVAVQLPLTSLQRQIARQVLVVLEPIRVQTSPGLQSAPPAVQVAPTSFVRVVPGQVQST